METIPKKRGAFTLVELLVVIAIISVLAALLLPTLQQGLRSADRINCTSRLRQIGLSMQLYMNDHNGWIFAINSWGTVRPTLCRYQFGTNRSLIPEYWFNLFPDNLRICPTLESAANQTPYSLARLDLFQWGYATPMLDITSDGPMNHMPFRRVDTNGDTYSDYCRPLHPGVARLPTGEPYVDSYWTGSRMYDPAGKAPLAADLHFISGGAQTFMSSHSTGAIKGRPAQMLGEGSNSVWGDGHVQWNDWPGSTVSGYPTWVISGRSGREAGWVANGNTYYNHYYWVLNGRK